MCVVCRLNRIREMFVLCFVVGTVCFPFPKFAFLFPDDVVQFFVFFDPFPPIAVVGGLSAPCTSADPLDSTPSCLVPTRVPKNRKNGSDPEPTQKYQNPGEVSKVELTHPGFTYYLLPMPIAIGYLLDIY